MFESYGRTVFKNRQALSFDYVPPKLVHRDAQLKRLAILFRPVVESNCSQNAFLFGSVWTGKTVTATRSLDGAAFAACSNAVTELSNGWYKIDLSSSDMNGNTVALRFSASGCIDTKYTIITGVT